MARKLKTFLVLTVMTLSTASASNLSLKGLGKNLNFKPNKSGLMISSSASNSQVENKLKLLSSKTIKEILKKKTDLRLAPGVRLCVGLDARVWVLEDDNKNEWSICEFSDGSAILADDLGKIIQQSN